jgi:hypothetical protein
MRHVENWDLDPTRVIALVREGDQVVWRVEEVSRAYGALCGYYVESSL